MAVMPLAVLCGLFLTVAQQLHATGKDPVTAAPTARCLFYAILIRLLHRRLRWAAASVAAVSDAVEEVSALRLERVATVVLLEYAVVWYLCVDVAVLTAAGLLGAVSTLGSLAACRGSAVAVAVLYVGQLALCAAVRPFTTLFSHVHTLFSLTLGAVSVWCQVWYLFASARDGADLDALGALLTVSAVCDIVVSAASMLRTLMDVVEALRACRRHVHLLMARATCSGTVGVPLVVSAVYTPLTLAQNEVPADVGKPLAEYDDLLAECDDARFWRSDGSAAVDGGGSGLGAVVYTAFEEMLQRHRGVTHDQLLHFDDPVLLE